jgi:cytochrome o ubiquinol oxidase subunit IV
MNSNPHDSTEAQATWKSYILGFVLSIALTLFTYFIVVRHSFPRQTIVITISTFAILQAIVQLILFLHLAQESKPRSKLFMFLLMIAILIIVIAGTLWIMYDLDARMMIKM